VAADALIGRLAETDSALVLGDSAGNAWRIVPDGANSALNVTKNGSVVGFNGRKRVVAKTASYTVLENECGTYFIANHGSTPVVFTLPDPATCDSGVWYVFYNVGAAAMTITSGDADTLVVGNDAAADSISYATSNEVIGWSCEVFTDGTLWYLRNNLALEAFTATVVTA